MRLGSQNLSHLCAAIPSPITYMHKFTLPFLTFTKEGSNFLVWYSGPSVHSLSYPVSSSITVSVSAPECCLKLLFLFHVFAREFPSSWIHPLTPLCPFKSYLLPSAQIHLFSEAFLDHLFSKGSFTAVFCVVCCVLSVPLMLAPDCSPMHIFLL